MVVNLNEKPVEAVEEFYFRYLGSIISLDN